VIVSVALCRISLAFILARILDGSQLGLDGIPRGILFGNCRVIHVSKSNPPIKETAVELLLLSDCQSSCSYRTSALG
jgi:hypothetical protein